MKYVRSIAPIALIFCLALLVRIVYNNVVAHNYVLVGDAISYNALAINIIKEHCFCRYPSVPTVDRAPLWPAVIALIYSIVGQHNYFVRLFLCCVDSGTCVLLYLFARDLFRHRFGLVAGLLVAVYPQMYMYVDWLYSETLFIFLVFAFCYALFRFQRTSKRTWIVWSGVFIGLLSLSRPNGLFFFDLFVLWAVIVGWRKILPWRLIAQSTLAITVILCVFVAPWTIRNYILTQTFIPGATGDGTVLIGSYNDVSLYNHFVIGKWVNPRQADPILANRYKYAFFDGPRAQIARETAYKRAAEQWILRHISSLPTLFEYHLLRIWAPAPDEVYFPGDASSQIFVAMVNTFPLFIYPLAAFGLLLTWKRWRELLFIYFVILLMIVQSIVFYGNVRLISPIQPMLLLLAVGTVWSLTSKEPGTLLGSLSKHIGINRKATNKLEQSNISTSSE